MENIWNNENLMEALKGGGIAIMPTDTIYGVIGQALKEGTVERIYSVKRRTPEKPNIILIGEIKDLEKFSVEISEEQKKVLNKTWPGPVSVVLDCEDNKFEYLHRGTKTLAFRLPGENNLQNLLKKVGPLVATSANIADQPAAKNIAEAKNYFGDLVDLYIDGGEANGKPSKLIKLHKDGSETILRE